MIVAGLGEQSIKRFKSEVDDIEDFEKTTTAKSVPDKSNLNIIDIIIIYVAVNELK